MPVLKYKDEGVWKVLPASGMAVDSTKLGGNPPEYYATADSVSQLSEQKVDKANVANNFITTEEGFVADARAIKTLDEKIDAISEKATYNPFIIGANIFNTNAQEGTLSDCEAIQDGQTINFFVKNEIPTPEVVEGDTFELEGITLTLTLASGNQVGPLPIMTNSGCQLTGPLNSGTILPLTYRNNGTDSPAWFTYESAGKVVSDAMYAEIHNYPTNTATGNCSHAEGYCTGATGANSHAEGQNTYTSGTNSHAEGHGSRAYAQNSHAEGALTRTYGINSHAEGEETYASGIDSHAGGYQSFAYGDYSHAEGKGSFIQVRLTGAANSTTYTCTNPSNLKKGQVIRYNTSFARINSINGGTITLDRTLDSEINLASQQVSVYTIVSSGVASHAEGSNTIASGNNSHAEGLETTASGNQSHAEGAKTIASGYQSHAEGYQTGTSSSASHAEGYQAKINTNLATGAHAEGYNSSITSRGNANGAHAEGYNSSITASQAIGAHVEGKETIIQGYSADGAHAEGWGTIACGPYQHVQGRGNIANSSMAHIVGASSLSVDVNGNVTGIAERKNIHTIDWSGNAWFQGDVYVGSDGGLDKDDGSKKLLSSADIPIPTAADAGKTLKVNAEGKFVLVKMILLTIEQTDDVVKPYFAEEGMTWGEWLNSEYNTDGYIWKTPVDASEHIADSTDSNAIWFNGDLVLSSDTVVASADYYLGKQPISKPSLPGDPKSE